MNSYYKAVMKLEATFAKYVGKIHIELLAEEAKLHTLITN